MLTNYSHNQIITQSGPVLTRPLAGLVPILILTDQKVGRNSGLDSKVITYREAKRTYMPDWIQGCLNGSERKLYMYIHIKTYLRFESTSPMADI